MADERKITVRTPLAPGLYGVTTSMDEMVARRFSPAPSVALYKEVRKIGWQEWMRQQLASPFSNDDHIKNMLERELPLSTKTFKECVDYARDNNLQFSGVPISAGNYQRKGTHILRQLFTKRHVAEVMAEFWLDHFSLPYIDKAASGTYDVDLKIREIALTSFPKILKFIYSNLKIYSYLDNDQNATRNNSEVGINQNLGRETLELYTLGVGNYTEADVQALSIIFSGWGSTGDGYAGLVMNNDGHYFTDSITLLGRTYDNRWTHVNGISIATGVKDKVIEHLSMHPATIKKICTKLAKRFVSESPSRALIASMEEAYRRNNGDIKALIWAMLYSSDFSSSAGAKIKRPGEYINSVHRSMEVIWDMSVIKDRGDAIYYINMQEYRAWLATAGHEPRTWQAPDGFPDNNAYWLGASSMIQEFNTAFIDKPIDRELKRRRPWHEILELDITADRTQTATKIVRSLTGYTPSPAILRAVLAKLNDMATPWDKRVDAAVGLTYASPLAWLR